ncbi:hypothetical protein [Paenibacillus macerans]|uniref:hypothetical protein n=1 Tax=Paenibacillus macerans TaxID=44252 RepID=UPI003D31EA6E
MDLIKIYKQMRAWEEVREREKKMLNGVIELDPRILKICKEQQETIKEKLLQFDVDVEYILTSIFPYLKKEAWILDHGIKLNKIENGCYEYELYKAPLNGDAKPLKLFSTLEEAVTEILSYYPEIARIKTVEQVISELEFK